MAAAVQKRNATERTGSRAIGALLCLLLGCARGSPVAPQPNASEPSAVRLPAPLPAPLPPQPRVELIALVELPRGDATAGLSGAWFDPGTRSLFALQDTQAQIVPLIASADFRSWTVGEPLPLRGRPDASWDGEAITRAGAELFAVTVESSARIERFSLTGEYRGLLSVPAAFARARSNKGLEALAAAPSGRFLFFANEAALPEDGELATRTSGTRVRVVRHALTAPASPDRERAYLTDPLAQAGGEEGELGVSDLAALSDSVLLVLERGYQPGYGNSVRIFRVDLAAEGELLPKTLIADLGALPAGGVAPHAPQPNPLLENYEALCVGPRLHDGRTLLFVISDDNARAEQRPRVLVLAARLP